MVLYDGEARGNLKVVEQELNDEGLEGGAEDEKCNRTCEEGEADEHIEAEVAAEASSEECEDSSDSEVKVIYGWND